MPDVFAGVCTKNFLLTCDLIFQMPDVAVYEKTGGTDNHDSTASVVVKVLANGECATSISRTTHMTCKMDISAFPFDKQNCMFTVGSQVVLDYSTPLYFGIKIHKPCK